MTEAQKPDFINRTDFSQVSENHQQENCGRSKFYRSELISQCIGPAEQTGKAVQYFFMVNFLIFLLRWSALPSLQVSLIQLYYGNTQLCFTEQSDRVLCREQKWKSSKPPVTKVKLGLDLEQHELSVIPEVDTSKSCNISFTGNICFTYLDSRYVVNALPERYSLEEMNIF